MGCDIFLYFEEKDYLGKWKEVEVKPNNILPESRYYEPWSFLFGVNDNLEWGFEKPLFANRGLPEDCSMKDVLEDYKNPYSDLHSWTYVYANEVSDLVWLDNLKDCYFRIFLEWVFPQLSTSYRSLKNIRMTVCFHS